MKLCCVYFEEIDQICKLKASIYSEIEDDERQLYQNNYSDVFDYGWGYRNAVSSFVIFRKEVQQIVLKELDDEEPLFYKFFHRCMLEGYMIAQDRIRKNIQSELLIDHEIIKTKQDTVIKIFPTPYGFLMRDKIVDHATSGTLVSILDEYFVNYSIFRIDDPITINKFKTRLLYKFEGGSQVFYYKRRELNDEYMPFGGQDRNNPFTALIMQGQINLTLSKED